MPFVNCCQIYVFSYFPFGTEGRIWDLIVSVPDLCLSFYFAWLHVERCFVNKYLQCLIWDLFWFGSWSAGRGNSRVVSFLQYRHLLIWSRTPSTISLDCTSWAVDLDLEYPKLDRYSGLLFDGSKHSRYFASGSIIFILTSVREFMPSICSTIHSIGITYFSLVCPSRLDWQMLKDCLIFSVEGLAMILEHSLMEISSRLRSKGKTCLHFQGLATRSVGASKTNCQTFRLNFF